MFVSRVAVSLGIPGLKKKSLVKITRRLKEHKRAVRVGDNNSKVAQHANQFVHSIDVGLVIFTRDFFLRPGIRRPGIRSYVFAGVARAEL